jgi:hypothetical protein
MRISPLMAVALLREQETETRRRAEERRRTIVAETASERRPDPQPSIARPVLVPHCSVW